MRKNMTGGEEVKKFSFVIPTYQNKEQIRDTLEVLNYQKGYGKDDYEVVLVDDGSTDGTGEYIKGVNENYGLKYIYLERNSDSCRSRARNAGWKEARGEVIIFIDGDIFVKEDYLSEIDRCMKMAGNTLLIGNIIMLLEHIPHEIISDRKAFGQKIGSIKKFGLDPRQFIFYRFSYNPAFQLYPWLQVFGANLAVKRKWLVETGGFDENFKGWGHEDIELGYTMYKKGLNIVMSTKLEVFHQCRPCISGPKAPGGAAESRKNIGYFLSKHPAAIDASLDRVYGMFEGKCQIDMVKQNKVIQKKVFDFRKREELETLKQDIIKLSGEEGWEIIVNDYIGDTDLDIWIQILGKRVSTPKYYPISKINEFKKVLGFRIVFYKLLMFKFYFAKKVKSVKAALGLR